MLLFAIQLDEERIRRDKTINLEGAYKTIEKTFAQGKVSLYKIEDGIHYYSRNIDEHDYEELWLVNMVFDKVDWFKKYINIWKFINIEDGFILEEENLLEDEQV